MKDARNLAKLFSHLPPETFRIFVIEEFGFPLPELNGKDEKRKQRADLKQAINGLTVSDRQKVEEIAEKVVLLCDAPGQDATDGVREEIFDDEDCEAFDKLSNQYGRSLWLYRNEFYLFKRAPDWRQADHLHQSESYYDGFVAPKELKVPDDDIAVREFHEKPAAHRLHVNGCLNPNVNGDMGGLAERGAPSCRSSYRTDSPVGPEDEHVERERNRVSSRIVTSL